MRQLIEELTSISLDTAEGRARFNEIVDMAMKPGTVPDEIFHEVVVMITCRQEEMRAI